jgi:RNA polymerase sigma factor (sigma-70 family)
VNLTNSYFRRKRLERAYLRRSTAERRTLAEVPDTDRRDELWKDLQRLPARQRTAIVLRIYEDQSEQRVAEILGCRPGTVRSLVSRGLAELRIHVRSDGDE